MIELVMISPKIFIPLETANNQIHPTSSVNDEALEKVKLKDVSPFIETYLKN